MEKKDTADKASKIEDKIYRILDRIPLTADDRMNLENLVDELSRLSWMQSK